MQFNKFLFLMLASLTVLALGACSSSDDDPGDPGGGNGDQDTIAPRVLMITPEDESWVYDTHSTIMIQFSEPMNPNTIPGNITTSSGAMLEYTWTSDRELFVDSFGWPEATEITVTVGTGVADLAGNNLASSVSATFMVVASQLSVMEILPESGETDVNRNANITVRLTEPFGAGALQQNITISDGTKANYAFGVTEGLFGRYILNPVEDFPAETEITVTIAAELEGQYSGTSLPAPVTRTFTTGLVLDDTPPTILSITPASGATLPVDQGTIVVQFDEPVDLDNFTPPAMNGQFAWAFGQSGIEPELSPDGTELTVYLAATLPEGIPLEVVLANYQDVLGNVQTAETTWNATVAGTADPFPMVDGHRYTTSGTFEEGELGNTTPTNSGDDYRFYEILARETNGHWEYREYEWQFSELDSYNILSVSGSEAEIIGFGEDEGEGFQEYMLSGSLIRGEFPYSTGNTWSSSATVSMSGETLSATSSGEVMGQADLEIGMLGGTLVTWTGAWHVELDLAVSIGSEVLNTEVTDYWIVPGIGIVRERYHEEFYDSEVPGWYAFDAWMNVWEMER